MEKRRVFKIALIVRTLIKNANREIYGFNMLDRWLEETDKYADKIIIIDDDSTDGTFEKCRDYSDKIVIKRTDFDDFYTQEQFMNDEVWELVRKHAKKDDWILALDSDEFLEPSFLTMKDSLLNNNAFKCYSLQFIHMWTEDSFRIDGVWGGRWVPRLFRFEDRSLKFNLVKGVHMGGLPIYIKSWVKIPISCGTLHYGYATDEMRKFKSEKYLKYSIYGGDKNCARSILEKPTLVKLSSRLKIMEEMKLDSVIQMDTLGIFIKEMGKRII